MILVVEDDPFLRLIQLVLDPSAPADRLAAFADFFAHDEPDFPGWCRRVAAQADGLWPAEVRLVDDEAELVARLPSADALVVESLEVGRAQLAAADRLRVVQKYGAVTRNIDPAACRERGVRLLTLRRRANIACAEQALALMLGLAKQLQRVSGRISLDQLTAAGFSPRPFDTRHTPNSNWARIGGLRTLWGATVGIIGLGEIGREIALRAWAFGMRVVYTQRTRLAEADEQAWHAHYLPLDQLLAESDWVIPQLPSNPSTRGLLGRAELARMKPGACLVNVSRADVVDRAAVLEALASGRLGGFALDPQYAEPGRADDPLLGFPNVLLTPHLAAQPRFNALDDIQELIVGLAQALRAAQ